MADNWCSLIFGTAPVLPSWVCSWVFWKSKYGWKPRLLTDQRYRSTYRGIPRNRAVKKPRKLLTVALRIRGLRGKPCTVPIKIRGPLDPTKPIRRYLNPLWWTRLEPWSNTSTNKEPNWKKWSVRSLGENGILRAIIPNHRFWSEATRFWIKVTLHPSSILPPQTLLYYNTLKDIFTFTPRPFDYSNKMATVIGDSM